MLSVDFLRLIDHLRVMACQLPKHSFHVLIRRPIAVCLLSGTHLSHLWKMERWQQVGASALVHRAALGPLKFDGDLIRLADEGLKLFLFKVTYPIIVQE